MVKVQDGSLIYAGQLLSGEGQDDDGHSLKFKSNGNETVPVYTAEAPMRDGSGRKKVYAFDLGTTQVRVSVTTVEPEEKDKEKEKEKEKKEEEPPTATATKARVVNTEMPKSSKRGTL